MAIAISTITQPGSAASLKLCTWALLANGDSGAPFQFADWADRCLQISGTFGTGGTVIWEGSNDGINYATLNDINGNALSLTAAAIKQMNEAPLWIRPRVSAGDGTTSILATVLARRIVQTGKI